MSSNPLMKHLAGKKFFEMYRDLNLVWMDDFCKEK
jgi:hypothetical protein